MNQRYQTFTQTIASIYYDIQKIKTAKIAEFGLKGSQVQCIFHLYQHPEGLTISSLSKLCEEDKAAISRNIPTLQKEGIVKSEIQEGRKYGTLFSLTDKGNKVANHLEQSIFEAVEKGSEGLTDHERQIFYSTLELIHQNLQAYQEEL